MNSHEGGRLAREGEHHFYESGRFTAEEENRKRVKNLGYRETQMKRRQKERKEEK